MTTDIVAFALVTCWSVAPGRVIPVLRFLVVLYGFGVGPP